MDYFIQRLESSDHFLFDNQQYHEKVLLNIVRLNNHALGFHVQNQILHHNKQYHRKVLLNSFHLNMTFKVSSTDTKTRATLVQLLKQHHKKVLIISFHLNGHTREISSTDHHPVQHNKQHHRIILLSSLHLNGHTLGFHPWTQKLVPSCNMSNSIKGKYFSVALI